MMALVIDLRTYQVLSPAEKDRYKDELKKHFLNAIEINKDDLDFLEKKSPEQYKQEIMSSDLKQDLDYKHLNTSTVYYQSKIFSVLYFVDDHWLVPTKFLKEEEKLRVPENYEEDKSRFSHYHELSHALYRRGEPGADYMAAVQTLIDNPNSRGTLQLIADYRTITGAESWAGLPSRDNSHSNATEIAAGIAVKAALSVSSGELASLSALSPEGRRAMLARYATEFDRTEALYDELRPEKLLELALYERRKKLEDKEKDPSDATVARDLLENDCPYDRDSVTYKLLESLVASRTRHEKNNYRELFPPHNPSKLQKEWESVAVSVPKSEEPAAITPPAPPNSSRPFSP